MRRQAAEICPNEMLNLRKRWKSVKYIGFFLSGLDFSDFHITFQ